jgi:hypothetical protein
MNIIEEWRECAPGYEVSNLGNVRGVERVGIAGQLIPERLMSKYATQQGYLQVALTINGKTASTLVARLVAKAFIPNPFNLPEVNHLVKREDGTIDKSDNRVCSLEWCTKTENMQHGVNENLFGRGEVSVHSKLCDDDVITIKEALLEGMTVKDIAKAFDISITAINDIRNEVTWAHVVVKGFNKAFVDDNKFKISIDTILEIQSRCKKGARVTNLSREFNIPLTTVRDIRDRKQPRYQT